MNAKCKTSLRFAAAWDFWEFVVDLLPITFRSVSAVNSRPREASRLEAKTHEAEAKTHEAEAEATTHEAEAEAEARFFGLEAEARPRGLTSLLLCVPNFCEHQYMISNESQKIAKKIAKALDSQRNVQRCWQSRRLNKTSLSTLWHSMSTNWVAVAPTVSSSVSSVEPIAAYIIQNLLSGPVIQHSFVVDPVWILTLHVLSGCHV